MTPTNPPYSNLQLVERVEEWPYVTKDVEKYRMHMLKYYYFLIEGYKAPFGYVHKSLVQKMSWPEYWKIDHEKRFLTLTSARNFEQRTKLMEETLRCGIEIGSINPDNGEHVLDFDGFGVDLFGVVNYSVHMLGWVMTKDGLKRYWVPRRSMTKMSFPGMLDNTVGGSLSSGEKPIDCIIRECEEEISLDPTYTRANIQACGTASYQMTRADLGEPGCQLQVQYLYEMEFTEEVIPKIGDGEVGEIHLKTLDEVRTALANGEFKLNYAMT